MSRSAARQSARPRGRQRPGFLAPRRLRRGPQDGRGRLAIGLCAAGALLGILASCSAPQAGRTTSAGTPVAGLGTAGSARSAAHSDTRLKALGCHVTTAMQRPRDHTTFRIRVRTSASARVRVAGPLRTVRGQRPAGRANRHGARVVRLSVGSARPGVAVLIRARVALHRRNATCGVSVRPRPGRRRGPAQHSASSCRPRTDGGNCYEPGEFCRDSDHGASGIAGDGERIVCEDNDGWRWEPASSGPPAPSPAPVTSPSPPAPAPSCYPLSDEGTCYEPGEFCRDSDHGASGIAGDGERIVCADNDGWRWEPA